MKMKRSAAFLVVVLVTIAVGQEFGGHALFVRTSPSDAHSRVQRGAPASPADVMAQNILEWIQGIYRQGARKTRQQSESNAYLPPYSTQRPPERPRPFQPPSTVQQPSYSSPGQNEVTNYQRPSSLYTPPSAGFPSSQPPSAQSPSFSTPRPTYVPPSSQQPSTSYNPRPTPQPSYSNTGSSAFPPLSTSRSSTTYLPPQSAFPSSSPRPPPTTQSPPSSGGYASSIGASTNYGYPSQQPSRDFGGGSSIGSAPTGIYSTPGGFTASSGYSSQRPTPGFPSPGAGGSPGGSSAGGYPSPSGFTTYGYPSESPSPSFPTSGGGTSGSGSYDNGAGYPSESPSPGFPTSGGGSSGSGSYDSGAGYPSTPGGAFPPFPTPGPTTGGSGGTGSTGSTGGETSTGTGTAAGEGTTGGGTIAADGSDQDDDLKHPPHIHSLDVECSKTMMTINIEFNRAFDGVIYSKGFYMNPECRYVEQNSGQTKYSFTVSLDSCGTQFINDFEGEAGQAYLENVLVLQNEPGIQEVWDTVRRVRCLWEGNINKALTVNFSVDMLNQEIVTFSGDTATAKLDIQVGRGPFAPAADGLVKIGETMTLVVSVEGDPAFDLQVRDCVARDESSTNTLQLTDERGCILKPKLFGAFQKTNDTGNTGASIIAYAFFQAFKFPDVMDLFIECNVELCKTDCEPCPDGDQQIEPGRRRRSIPYIPSNTSAVLLSDPIRVRRGFKVILIDDLSKASNEVLEHLEETVAEEITRTTNVCMSNSGFYAAISLILSTVAVTTLSAVVFYMKLQRVYRAKYLNS